MLLLLSSEQRPEGIEAVGRQLSEAGLQAREGVTGLCGCWGRLVLQLEDVWVVLLLHSVDEIEVVGEAWGRLHTDLVGTSVRAECVLVAEFKLSYMKSEILIVSTFKFISKNNFTNLSYDPSIQPIHAWQ